MLGLASLVLSFAVPPAPPPRPAALEIAWAAPEECPDEEALRERVLALADLDETGEGTLFVDGAIEMRGGQYVLRLRTVLGELSDEHEFGDASCRAVVDAAALVVAVSIEPSIEPDDAPKKPALLPVPTPPAEPVSEPRESPSFAPAPQPVSSPGVRVPQPRRTPTSFSLGVGGRAEVGSLPGVTAGPRLSAEVQWEHASVSMFGYYGAPRRTDVVRDVSGLVQMGAGGVLGCAAVHPGTLRVPLCGVFEAGALGVQSRGLDPRNGLTYLWVALGAHVGVERRWSRVGVFAAAEGLMPVQRAQVLVGERSLYEASWVSFRLIVGLKIFFATDSA